MLEAYLILIRSDTALCRCSYLDSSADNYLIFGNNGEVFKQLVYLNGKALCNDCSSIVSYVYPDFIGAR